MVEIVLMKMTKVSMTKYQKCPVFKSLKHKKLPLQQWSLTLVDSQPTSLTIYLWNKLKYNVLKMEVNF